MKCVILCGGKGLRMKGYFKGVPKPLILIRNKPILSYIIEHYHQYGINEFLILVGRQERLFHDFKEDFENRKIKISIVQTGYDASTLMRIKQIEDLLENEDLFLLTYGDGISNINIKNQISFHTKHHKLVTISAVKPRLPFGLLKINNENTVTSFIEKPVMNQFINGGFFVLNPNVFKYFSEDLDFEKDLLPRFAMMNEIKAFEHTGYWRNIDTFKDVVELNEIDDFQSLLNE